MDNLAIPAGKKTGYFFVIVGFSTLFGTITYFLASELFSDKGINNLISKTVMQLESDPKISNELGLPIKYYGETTRYNRQMQASHLKTRMEDGSTTVTLNFYVNGSKNEGRVIAELNDHAIDVWEFTYLTLELKSINLLLIVDGRRLEIVKPPIIRRKKNNIFERMKTIFVK